MRRKKRIERETTELNILERLKGVDTRGDVSIKKTLGIQEREVTS